MSQHVQQMKSIQAMVDPENALCEFMNKMNSAQRVKFLEWVGWKDAANYQNKTFNKGKRNTRKLMKDLGLKRWQQ